MIRQGLHYGSTDQFRYCATDLKKMGFSEAVVFAGKGCKKVECCLKQASHPKGAKINLWHGIPSKRTESLANCGG
jgi:hypothetical protein